MGDVYASATLSAAEPLSHSAGAAPATAGIIIRVQMITNHFTVFRNKVIVHLNCNIEGKMMFLCKLFCCSAHLKHIRTV